MPRRIAIILSAKNRDQPSKRERMSTIKSTFTAIIKIRGVNPYILVSASRASAIKAGSHKPLPVLARINGKPDEGSRTNMMPAGDGSFYLYLNGEMRRTSATAVGHRVHVEIDFDATYRSGPQHAMPRWFKQALTKNPLASKNWIALTPSRKKEILRYFARLKSSETRARNLARALVALSGKTSRFLGREWKNGS